MNEPWFNPAAYSWIPGTVFGCTAGLWGGLAGTFAPRGRARGLVIGLLWTLIGVAVIFLAAGVVAWASGQPHGVWYGLALPGVIGVPVLGFNAPTVFRAYRQAEARQIEARDLLA